MPWRDPQSAPLTRIAVVSQIPSESGVYAVLDGDVYLLVGEAWNLKARLLELMNVIQDAGELHVIYEFCAENERQERKVEIGSEFLRVTAPVEVGTPDLPGITFWNTLSQ